jgi:type IV pilus assembly protein PilQ
MTSGVALAAGAGDAPAAESPVAQPAVDVNGTAAALSVAASTSQVISLTLDDVPLAEVVRLFTRVSGANIIAATSNLQGQVTANLQDVLWRPAFESILERQNLQLIEKPPASNIFVIEGRKSGEDPRISVNIKLNYAKVADVTALVTSVLGKDGTVTPFASGNTIVVNASAVKAAEVQKIIENLDRPRTQVSIETKIVQLTDATSKELGIDWQGLNGYNINANAMSATYQRNVGDATIPTRLTTTTRTYDSFGNEILSAGPVTTVTENKPVTTLRSLSATLTPDQFNVVLNMLQGATGTKLISNPKIIVANEEKAIIKMAQDEPNIRLTVLRSTVQGQSDQITSALDGTQPYFTYGITVEVTPRINTSSNITVTIKPELSSKISEKTAPDGNTFPIIDKKSVETIFSLADGSTAAIGGLITTSDSDTSSKVPLLGDIPYLGEWLFSYKGRTKSQTEVLIFVTVRLVDPSANMDPAQLPSETTLYTKPQPVDSALYLRPDHPSVSTNAAAAKAP